MLHLSFLLSVYQIPSSSQTTFSSSIIPYSSTHPYFPTFFLSVLNATPHFVCYPEDQLKWNLFCLVFVALPAAYYLVFQNVLLFILDHYLVTDNSSTVKKLSFSFSKHLAWCPAYYRHYRYKSVEMNEWKWPWLGILGAIRNPGRS